jgi:hypothetical protein
VSGDPVADVPELEREHCHVANAATTTAAALPILVFTSSWAAKPMPSDPGPLVSESGVGVGVNRHANDRVLSARRVQ